MPHISLKPPMSIAGTIGIPTDGDYDTGVVGLTPNDIFADAADKLDEFLAVLANIVAPPPGNLSGKDLVIIGVATYQAKIPNGAPASWIDPAGTLINTYIIDNILILQSPDQANYFIAGLVGQGQATAGQVTHVLDGVDGDVHDIAVDGVGVTGLVACTALVAHNAVFYRANAEISLAVSEGKSRHVLKHTQAGQSNELPLYYDDEYPTPSFEVSPTYTLTVNNIKWLSGIQYHGLGTTFNIDATAASGIFRKAYHPINVAIVRVPGDDDAHNPVSIPGIDDNWAIDKDMTLGNDIAQSVGYGTVELYKPDGQTVSKDTIDFPLSINTYTIVSTNVDDQFLDEDERLEIGTAVAWDPVAVLIDGNAQVYNGDLRHGADGDYPTHILAARYERKIYKPTASNGIMTFQGISYTDIDPYGTGDLNILLYLEIEDKWFDIGRVVGDDNGNGSGDSPTNSYGSRITGSGGIVDFSFLLHSTGLNNDEYRIVIIFNNSGGSPITRITGS